MEEQLEVAQPPGAEGDPDEVRQGVGEALGALADASCFQSPHRSSAYSLEPVEPVEVASVVVVYPDEERRQAAAQAQREEELAVSKARRQLRSRFAAVPVVVVAFSALLTFSICEIYWAPAWSPYANLHLLDIGVVDADRPVVAPAGLNGTSSSTSSVALGSAVVGALVKADLFRTTMLGPDVTYRDARELVRRNRYWAVLFVPQNLTSNFVEGFYATNASAKAYHNPVFYIHDPAKQPSAATTINAMVTAIVNGVKKAIQMRMRSGQFGAHSPAAPVETLVSPIVYTVDAIHPMSKNGWGMGTYFSFIFMYMSCMMGMTVSLAVFHRQDKYTVSFLQAVLTRFRATDVIVITSSGVITGILCAFDFPAAHSYASLWGAILLCGLAFSGIMMSLYCWIGGFGMITNILLLYLQMVTCDGLYLSKLMSPGWRVLHSILPLSHGVGLFRFCAFDTLPDDVGLHVGVLVAWVALGRLVSVLGMRFGAGDPKMKLKKN
eukprot:m51a1_g8437 hypothetical protein (494) ;mRNA; r:361082-362755